MQKSTSKRQISPKGDQMPPLAEVGENSKDVHRNSAKKVTLSPRNSTSSLQGSEVCFNP